MDLEIGMEKNGYFVIQKDGVIYDISGQRKRNKSDVESGGKLEELKEYIHQKIRRLLREERGEIEDDCIIKQSEKSNWDPVQGAVCEKGLTRFEWSSLVSVRSGVVIDGWHHPAFCERCKREEPLKNVFLHCRPKEEIAMLEVEVWMEFRHLGVEEIQVRWDDEFDDKCCQFSPRGLMNQVMISRNRESNKSKIEDDVRKLQQICGRYVKKIRLEKEYFKEIRKDGMEEGREIEVK